MPTPMKEGDHGFALTGVLMDPPGGTDPADLTGATVHFHAVEVHGRGEIHGVPSTTDSGGVVYVVSAEDSSIPGTYRYEFKATYADGRVLTYPNDSYLEFTIYSRLITDSS